MLCTLYIFWYSNASIEWGICTEWEWARARTMNSRKDTTSANTRAKTLWIELITGAFMKQNGTGIDHNKIMPHDECIGFDCSGCATRYAFYVVNKRYGMLEAIKLNHVELRCEIMLLHWRWDSVASNALTQWIHLLHDRAARWMECVIIIK